MTSAKKKKLVHVPILYINYFSKITSVQNTIDITNVINAVVNPDTNKDFRRR